MQSDVEKRRKARQRKALRRRLKIFFSFLIVISIITLAIMCFTVFFPIKRINVSGSEIYSKSEIIKASGLTTDDNLFVVSEEKIEDAIRKKLPYIDSVKLKRHLPDAVILTVVDAKEYSCFKTDDGYFTVSESGYVLSQQNECPENVFEIITNGVKCTIGEQVEYKNSSEKELVSTLTDKLSKNEINIDKIDVSNLLSISISVENKFDVNLGTNEYMTEKIAHLKSMINSIGDRSGEINLSMWTPENSQGSYVDNAE